MADDLFVDNGKIVKMEVDYSSTVTEKLPVCEKLAKVWANALKCFSFSILQDYLLNL